jgi:transcriptional regulator with XRE-family HTH domain
MWVMALDHDRLGKALTRSRNDRGWRQTDAVEAAKRLGYGELLSRATVQRYERGEPFVSIARVSTTLAAFEKLYGWTAGDAKKVLEGGVPTLVRDPVEVTIQDADVTDGSGRDGDRRSDLPMDAQIALERGRLIGVDVLQWEVEGEEFSLIIVARTGEYDTEEKRAVAMRQAEEWARIKRGIGRPESAGSASVPDGESA